MTTEDNGIVELQQIAFQRDERIIFKNVTLRIRPHKVTAIMGPSGTGKTTLLRLMTGLLEPQAGSVLVKGQDLAQIDRRTLYNLRRSMSMLFQSSALFTHLTVFDNVAFPLREHTELPESMIRDLVLMKLHSVGLRGARRLYPRELSGGMARRVALARAIALDPELVLYDEPFAGQDPISMGVLVQLIRLLNDALGMTSVIVSHDVNETLSIADYIYIIANGCVLAEGTPGTLRDNTQAHVQQFLQGLPDGPVPFHYPAQDYCDDLRIGG